MRDLEDREPERDPSGGGDHRGRVRTAVGTAEPGPLRVAFVASHTLSPLRLASAIYQRLSELPLDTIILLRQPMDKRRTLVTDLTAAELAKKRGHKVEWFQPEPGGRDAVYNRDFALVDAADRVEAFFEDYSMPGGTGHVVDAALARNRTVYAWLVQERGALTRIGDWEADEDVSF